MAFYLQIPNIKGSVTDSQHKNWIGIHHLNFVVDNSAFVRPGCVHDRISTIPHISDFTMTKNVDIASPKILEASLGGKVFDKVVVHVCNTDQKPYIEYTLHKAIIRSYDVEGDDSDTQSHSQIKEVFTINAVKIEMRYMPAGSTPLSAGYDLEKVQPA